MLRRQIIGTQLPSVDLWPHSPLAIRQTISSTQRSSGWPVCAGRNAQSPRNVKMCVAEASKSERLSRRRTIQAQTKAVSNQGNERELMRTVS